MQVLKRRFWYASYRLSEGIQPVRVVVAVQVIGASRLSRYLAFRALALLKLPDRICRSCTLKLCFA
jgi:hypothetical protein